MSNEPRIRTDWVTVQRNKLNIVTFVKNLLRSIAMVIVDIKNCHLGSGCCRNMMRSNGRIIEITKSTKHIGRRMVARRTTQAICRRCSSKNHFCGSERHVNRCPRCNIRTFNHWGRSFVAPVTKCRRRSQWRAPSTHSFA